MLESLQRRNLIIGTSTSRNPDDLMVHTLTIFKDYAERVIVHGDALSATEEDDREARFRNFAETGGSFGLTERHMVSMMFDGLFDKGPKCWCAKCGLNDVI